MIMDVVAFCLEGFRGVTTAIGKIKRHYLYRRSKSS